MDIALEDTVFGAAHEPFVASPSTSPCCGLRSGATSAERSLCLRWHVVSYSKNRAVSGTERQSCRRQSRNEVGDMQRKREQEPNAMHARAGRQADLVRAPALGYAPSGRR